MFWRRKSWPEKAAARSVPGNHRRSWRLGQTRPVKVVFIFYRNTLQAGRPEADGEKSLPEDRLAAYDMVPEGHG